MTNSKKRALPPSRLEIFAIITLSLASISIFLLPYLYSQKSWFNSTGIDYGSPSQMGDWIGGITAPFIAIMSSVLIYLTLKEQIQMNSQFKIRFESEDDHKRQQIDFQYFVDSLDNIQKSFEELEIYIVKDIQITGVAATAELLEQLIVYGNPWDTRNYHSSSILTDHMAVLLLLAQEIKPKHFQSNLGRTIFQKYLFILTRFFQTSILKKFDFKSIENIKKTETLFFVWSKLYENAERLYIELYDSENNKSIKQIYADIFTNFKDSFLSWEKAIKGH